MAVKNLTDVYMLMRSNSIRAKHTLEEMLQVFLSEFPKSKKTQLDNWNNRNRPHRWLSGPETPLVDNIRCTACPMFREQLSRFGEFHDDAGDTVALVTPDVEMGLYRGKKILQLPLWTDNLEQITSELAKIRNQLRDLDKLHDKHLNRPSLMDDHSEEIKIQNSTQTIGQLLHDCQSHVSIINRSALGKSEGSAERQLTENVVRAVAGQLRDVTEQFRKRQTDYCNRIKQRNNAGSFFENLQAEDSPTEAVLQSDMMFVTTQDLLTAEEVAQREQEIQGVVRSIHDLNLVFKEVARLVVEQGSVVDRIDYNVEHVQASVQQGLQQLHRAAAYQRSNAKLKCIVVLAVITIFMIIVLFVTKLG